MLLQYRNPYNSIRVFDEVELPDFVVLTGVNGAGKSQLLQAISAGHIAIDNINHSSPASPIRMFDVNSLVPNGAETFDRSQSRAEKEAMWSNFSAVRDQQATACKKVLSAYPRLDALSLRQITVLADSDTSLSDAEAGLYSHEVQSAKAVINAHDKVVVNQFSAQNPSSNPQLIAALRSVLKDVPILDWNKNEFVDSFPPSWTSVDVFQQSFARLFTEYAVAYETNRFRRFKNSEGENYAVLNDEEFIQKHGIAPWDFLNAVLTTAGLGYKVSKPVEIFDQTYTPVLMDEERGISIDFSYLSSGEKVIMSFALCIYYANDDRQMVKYPQVMLFDEIDAPLHPSMTLSLLRTIEDILVKDRGIKVILTTHSPSTVALAPASSIFAMNKSGRKRITKVTKDEALSILLAGVPSISLDYENRRQIFVESDYDVNFYDKVYQHLRFSLNPAISLNFMAAGADRGGGCDVLQRIVNQLADAGNRKVFGIIDWDMKNKESTVVKVLGQGVRYTIENYLLDPLLLAALLEKEKAVSKDELGFSSDENYMALAKADVLRLQVAADFIISKIIPHIEDPVDGVQTCTYVDGRQIDIPTWYLRHDGHKLEEIVKIAFPSLKRFHRPHSLKDAVIDHVLADIPGLIPDCFYKVFERIQQSQPTHSALA